MVVVPNPIVTLSESVLRENFRCSMKAHGVPIQHHGEPN